MSLLAACFKKAILSSSNRRQKKLYGRSIRAFMIALLMAAPMIAPREQIAQDTCPKEIPPGCFVQANRDIAFLIEASDSIAQRGQTYNVQLEGVLSAINDPTIIPRNGSVAVSVILFNEIVNLVVPLTEINGEEDARKIAATLETLKCEDVGSQIVPCPVGDTRYAGVIQVANVELSQARKANPKPGVRRAFLMSTDGGPLDLSDALVRVEEARNFAASDAIPFEMDVVLVGLDNQSEEFTISKNIVDQLVIPKPTSSLPGETFVINAGECNQDGAAAESPDCQRQANEFAELTREIIRGDVPAIQLAVNSDADTDPDTPVQEGEISLRQAIEQANCNGGSAMITLDSSVAGKTIRLTSALPALISPDITINGCSGEDCAPGITIDGGGQIRDGLVLRSNRNVIRGLKLINFTNVAIVIGIDCPQDAVGHNVIEQNTLENNGEGILVLGGEENERNLISRNNISRIAPSSEAPPTSLALIDLGGDGPTANDAGDADSGPNTLLNFPDSMTVTATADKITVTGKLNSSPASGSTVEIFAVTGFRLFEGRIVTDAVKFLGQADVDDSGGFTAADLAPSPTGIYTATVTDHLAFNNEKDKSSNTSELMADSADTPLPQATASFPSNAAFGSVNLNVPKTVTVTITNTGSAPLSVKGCAIGACPVTPNSPEVFKVSSCPTGPVNPGQTATVDVTFTPTVCGVANSCLFLQTDDPKNPQITIALTGSGVSSGGVAIQGGVNTLTFKRVAARGTPRSNPETQTFTINNAGCDAITLQSATLTRGGQTDNSNTFTVVPQGAQTGFPLTVGTGSSVTFAVRFNPVIPKVAGSQAGVSDLLPADITDTLTIQVSAGNPLTLTLRGRVKKGVKLINPTNPGANPLVTICRSGNEFVVEFSAWDANTDVSSATYQFRNGSGGSVGDIITVDIAQAIRERNIQQGQSFTITQRFTGANDNSNVASVQVTVRDGGASSTAVSSPIGSACSSTSSRVRR
ncbi:MAG: hypothetical protein WBV94_23060 [Blastocatellia bacterium]